MDKYYEQAVMCVKDYVLPAQRALFERCGGDLDRVYGESMNDASYFGKVLEPGRVYELGYHKCTCQMVLSGQVSDPGHCECTRHSIVYILNQLNPNSRFEVEILETILRGSEHCRFRITRKE